MQKMLRLIEQMFDGLDDADGAEDAPFDELVGMQGHVFHLVKNAFTSAWTAVANLTPAANEESSLLGQVTEMLKANAAGLSEAAKNLSTTVSTNLLKGSSVGTSRL
ncbi:hypothetical protein CQW23_20642 [Capsicum baccatum]|uniref:Uncharacterized protein n=1 Tax=Capsicum baccatum TaxID=33114 RepID=A0A2G2W976_CAPBA|nr:hypothetical protein CQW23_20642 [Capsicum baccatum]